MLLGRTMAHLSVPKYACKYACGFGVVVDYCVYVNTVMIDAVASFILEIVLQKIITVSSVIGKQ